MNFISTVVANTILVISMFYVVSKLLEQKINFKNYRLYLSIFSLIVLSLINYYFVNSFIKVVFIVSIFCLLIKLLFRENLIQSLILSIYYELIIVLSENIFALIITVLFKMNSQEIVENFFGNFWANLIISMISIIIVNTKIIKKVYKLIRLTLDKLNKKHILIMCLFVLIVLNILEATLYYDFDFRYLIIFNVFIIIFCFSIIMYSFNTNNKYNKVYDKYNTTLNSLKEYEDILDKYRISNHENKNQLLTIRNMIVDKNKKVVKYVDELVKNKLKDDEIVMQEVSIIPAGGLRGLIYSKILYMKENKIEYELNISKDIRTVDLINKLDNSDMLDICQIIGVYIDNAIQAVNNIKEKYVSIDMYLEDNNLVFEISNYYEGKIELDKLETNGYTTKGSNHGYGLSLTKEIIEKNKKLKNEKRLTKEIFTQVLKIKMN